MSLLVRPSNLELLNATPRARLRFDPIDKVEPEQVLHAFNTWAFKRCQPTEPKLLLATVTAAVAAFQPVAFVFYWGKGPRAHAAAPERCCLAYLDKMRSRIAETYAPGAAVTLIFTDTHAGHNGHAPEAMTRYFGEMASAAREHGFACDYLSRVVAAARGRISEVCEAPSAAVRARLEQCAAKWYRGEGSTAHGAEQYYLMNMVERRAVGLAYPKSIFVTFNGSEYRELFPDNMPVFYMYALRKGVAVKPWFADDALAHVGGDGGAARTEVPVPLP